MDVIECNNDSCISKEKLEQFQNVADVISKNTGIRNKYIGVDKGNPTWKFAYGNSYMKYQGNNELYFCCNDKNGKHLWGYGSRDTVNFVSNTSIKINNTLHNIKEDSKVMRNKDIVTALIKARNNKEDVHYRIYDDGCWILDIDSFTNGLIRFWVSFEDKRNGHARSSLVSIRLENGELNYNTDGIIIKKAVWSKLQSVVKVLASEGLYKLG